MDRVVALRLLKDLNLCLDEEEISEDSFFVILNNYVEVEE